MKKEVLEEAIGLLQELVKNECVNPPGKEMKSIMTIANYLEKKQIEYEILKSAPERGNLIAKIKGAGDGPTVMFGPAHVDVVPAMKIDEWEVPPFSGEKKEGYIWGRGTIDMLFIVVAQLITFTRLIEEKTQLNGTLLLVICSDEEKGGTFGTKWLMENHPEKMACDLAFTEIGGIPLSKGRFGFMLGEKGATWLRLTFSGETQHGSMPYKSNNAVLKASQAALKLAKYRTKVITKYLKYLLQGAGFNRFFSLLFSRKLFLPLLLKLTYKRKPSIAKSIHSLTRMTISPNVLSGGKNTNVVPAKATMEVDIRTMPGQNYDSILKVIKKALGKKLFAEAEIETISEGGIVSFGNANDFNTRYLQDIEKAIQKVIPKAKAYPILNPGATDLRFLREKGVFGCGFALMDPETDLMKKTGGAHAINERLSIKTFEYTIQAYYYLAKELLCKNT